MEKPNAPKFVLAILLIWRMSVYRWANTLVRILALSEVQTAVFPGIEIERKGFHSKSEVIQKTELAEGKGATYLVNFNETHVLGVISDLVVVNASILFL